MRNQAGRRRLGICVTLALLAGMAAVVLPTPVIAAERGMRVDTVLPSALGAAASATSRLSQFLQVDIAPFEMIGASWVGPGTDQARVRVRRGATWGGWTPLEADEEDGPDPGSPEAQGGRMVTRPLWLGSADGYELQAPPDALQVNLVRSGGPQVRLRPGARAQAAAAPPIADRGAWGARPPRGGSGVAPSLKMAFVHHTTGPNGYGAGDVPRMIRAMQAYHMDANGWGDIGYHFLVDRFGRIWEGRAGSRNRPVIGAHTQGFNNGSLGVAVLGTFTRADPSPAALDGVARVVGFRLGNSGVDPGGQTTMTSAGNDRYRPGRSVRFPTVAGHRDGKSTACPGQRLYDRLPQIRASARGYAATPGSPLDSLLGPSGVLAPVTGATQPLAPSSPRRARQ
jgi:hypothetical protein